MGVHGALLLFIVSLKAFLVRCDGLFKVQDLGGSSSTSIHWHYETNVYNPINPYKDLHAKSWTRHLLYYSPSKPLSKSATLRHHPDLGPCASVFGGVSLGFGFRM